MLKLKASFIIIIINMINILLAKIIINNRMKRDYYYGYDASTEEMDQWPHLRTYNGESAMSIPLRNSFLTYQPKYNYNDDKRKLLKSLKTDKVQIIKNYIESPFSFKNSIKHAETEVDNLKKISNKIETTSENNNKNTLHLNFAIDRKQKMAAKRIFNLNDTKNLENIVMARFNELFISRKRYESDLIKLRKYYEVKCEKFYDHQRQQNNSIKNKTIVKKIDNELKWPNIVRYEKLKPSEISIQTEIMVKDPELVTVTPANYSSLPVSMSSNTKPLNMIRYGDKVQHMNRIDRVKLMKSTTHAQNQPLISNNKKEHFNFPFKIKEIKIDNKLDFDEGQRKRRSIQSENQNLLSDSYKKNGENIYKTISNDAKNVSRPKEKFRLQRNQIGKNLIKKKLMANNFLFYEDDDNDDDYDDNYITKNDNNFDEMKITKFEKLSTPSNELKVKSHSVNSNTNVKVENMSLISSSAEHKNFNEEETTGVIRKRIRRRPPSQYYNDINNNVNDNELDDNDDDDDDDVIYNDVTKYLANFFHIISSPVKMVMSTFSDFITHKKHTNLYDVPSTYDYHSNMQQQQNDEYYDEYDYKSEENHSYDEINEDDNDAVTSSGWFSSWFNLKRRNKKIISTTVAPSKNKPSTLSTYSWLPSWLHFGMDTKTKDDYDKWFASWFGDVKNRAHRRKTRITTTTTTQMPHVPILTIVDPQRNPHNWIGILTNQMINNDTITLPFNQNPIVGVTAQPATTTILIPEKLKKLSYDKYQIWRLKPINEGQVTALEEYKLNAECMNLRWLRGPSLRGLTDVLISPKMFQNFRSTLSFDSIDHEVLIYDVGKAISYEKFKDNYGYDKISNNAFQSKKGQQQQNDNVTTISMDWHKYYSYDEIIKYLEEIQYNYPHLIELIHIGRSYEGRPLIVVKIEKRDAQIANTNNELSGQKLKLSMRRMSLANAVFIEAGVHGMEWIAPATATWIINKLLNIMSMNNTFHHEWPEQNLISNTTWYIMPILNVDGYIYSHDYDRFWKKTRSQHLSQPINFISTAMEWLKPNNIKRNTKCYGVDLDRNWHYQWNRHGTSKILCNENYAGPSAFSEPESKALAEFLLGHHAQIKLFISLQAYGQVLSYPLKGNSGYNIAHLDDMLDVAMYGIERLRKKSIKSRYKIDSTNDLIEHRSGSSDAFAAYELGIPFAYTLHLSDNGVHGYLLPSTSIESTASDAFEIIINMLDYV